MRGCDFICLASLHCISRRFGDSIPAAAVKNRVELARSASHSFRAASPFPCGLAATLFASLHCISRRFGDSIPAAAVKNRVELARSASHSFRAASPFPCGRRQKNEHRGRDDRKAGTLPCKHVCSRFSAVCRWHLSVLLLVPYLMEFILILALTSAMARMREISTSLSAWWTF